MIQWWMPAWGDICFFAGSLPGLLQPKTAQLMSQRLKVFFKLVNWGLIGFPFACWVNNRQMLLIWVQCAVKRSKCQDYWAGEWNVLLTFGALKNQNSKDIRQQVAKEGLGEWKQGKYLAIGNWKLETYSQWN